ncbi:TPA: gamma-glutamyl-phosphate reductase, partial [Morganella morganii]|nr:gamma-glutamyl-phosphate reductase [Morganella morganii]
MLEQTGKAAKAASRVLAQLSGKQKNRALARIADLLEQNSAPILAANELDIAKAREQGTSEAMLDRLLLTQARLESIAADVRKVCQLADP